MMEPTTPQAQPAPAPKPAIAPAPVSKWLGRGGFSNDIEAKKLHALVYGHPKCLSGDTVFKVSRGSRIGSRKYTLREMYDKLHGKSHVRNWKPAYLTTILSVDTNDHSIVHNQVLDVVYSGTKQVQRISSGGFSLDATPEHRFYSHSHPKADNEGFVQLKDLLVGDYVWLADPKKMRSYAFASVIDSISPPWEVDTYDLVMAEPHRNFVAQGFVVHNSGKTTFMGTFPGLVVIDADNGLVTLRGQKIFGFVPQKGEQNFKDVMDFLLDIKLKRNDFAPGGPLGYVETVGLDTITRLSELIKIDTMLHPVKGAPLDPDKDKADFDHWGFTKTRLGSIIDLLNGLPLHTVVTAWVEIIDDERSGTKMGLPKTEGKYKEVMAGRFDEVYYSYAQAGNPTKYYIRTTPYSYYIGGSRLGLPAQIENPSFALLQEALRKGSK